eukprot:1027942-Alexandrium_andersonii.AAC.1
MHLRRAASYYLARQANTKYLRVLRRTTPCYNVLRRAATSTAYCDVLRRATPYYAYSDIL